MTDKKHLHERIRDIVTEHIQAEEADDVPRTMRTYAPNSVYDDPVAGKVFTGKTDIAQQYHERFLAFPGTKRIIRRMVIDDAGAFVELTLRGGWTAPFQGIPPRAGEFVLHVAAHFEVDGDGLITRETTYYDRMALAVQMGILPDLASPLGRAWLLLTRPQIAVRKLAYSFLGLKL